MDRRPYPLKSGCCNSPTSHLCINLSDHHSGIPTPPERSLWIHHWTSLTPGTTTMYMTWLIKRGILWQKERRTNKGRGSEILQACIEWGWMSGRQVEDCKQISMTQSLYSHVFVSSRQKCLCMVGHFHYQNKSEKVQSLAKRSFLVKWNSYIWMPSTPLVINMSSTHLSFFLSPLFPNTKIKIQNKG